MRVDWRVSLSEALLALAWGGFVGYGVAWLLK